MEPLIGLIGEQKNITEPAGSLELSLFSLSSLRPPGANVLPDLRLGYDLLRRLRRPHSDLRDLPARRVLDPPVRRPLRVRGTRPRPARFLGPGADHGPDVRPARDGFLPGLQEGVLQEVHGAGGEEHCGVQEGEAEIIQENNAKVNKT